MVCKTLIVRSAIYKSYRNTELMEWKKINKEIKKEIKINK
jgi:hypothetical protein